MGLFDNLAKTVTVYFKTDGAEETKLELDDIGARAHDLSGDVKLGLDDGGLRARLEALKLSLRALEMKGADGQAFKNLANDFKGIGDQADGARLKTAALGLELRAIKDATQAGEGSSNGRGGNFFTRLVTRVLDGLFSGGGSGAGGAGSSGIAGAAGGIPLVGGPLGGAFAASPVLGVGAIAGIAAAGAALLAEVTALVSGFAAAGQAVVAFGALAYPTITRIFSLLGAGQRRLDKLPAGMRDAVKGVQGLEGEFGKLAMQLRPDVLKLFNIGLKIAGQLLGDLMPFAKAAFKALDPLLTALNKWLGSKQAQQFQNMFVKMSGPAITAIGKGLGNVALAVLQLLTIFSGHDVAHAINIFFDTVAGAIRALGWVIRQSVDVWHWYQRVVVPMFNVLASTAESWYHHTANAFRDVVGAGEAFGRWWVGMWHTVDNVWNDVLSWINKAISWFAALPGKIIHALAGLPGQLFTAGVNAIEGLIHGLESMAGGVISEIGHIASLIPAGIKSLLHIGSPSRVMYEIGLNITQGLINGLLAGGPGADAAAKKIANEITARIKAAQQYAQSVSSSAIQFAGIAGAVSGPGFSSYVPGHYNAAGNWVAASGTRPPSANAILRNMGADASRISRFADAIKKLANRGLDADLIAQIVAAGPDQGLDIADALLHAPGAIGRADRIQGRINRASQRLGGAAAASQYGGGYYQININGGISTAHEIALEVEKILKRLRRHRGGRNLGFG